MFQYYSQIGQDAHFHQNYFKDLKNGIFVDVGAHDGKHLSNTYFFEKELGWKGICIEANPHVFTKLKENRSCICLPYAVSNKEDIVSFLSIEGYSEMLSGIMDNQDQRHIQRIQQEINSKGGKAEIIQVQSKTLTQICEENNIYKIDYMSIDVEGAEKQVLEGIDFSKLQIDIINIENNYPDKFSAIVKILEENDYIRKKPIQWDEIFVHKDSQYA